jgi:serine/threonine-protein kinase
VLEGARFAHRHGVVHRDLKPQNVIVDAEGKATVTDFGIARAGVSEITQAGAVMGTPHYLSPEQAQGQDVTAVSDLYSIGVMLYEALTRRVPFEGDSAVAVAMKQIAQAPQRPSSINPQVSPALDAVTMRALEKEPGQRFQSADAFIAALDAALKDPGGGMSGTAAFAPLPPIVATPEEPVAEGFEEERKRRRLIWMLVAAAVLIGLLLGLLLTRDTTTEVPNVTGSPESTAISLLREDGFRIGDIRRVQREAPASTVLEQDPAASPPADEAALDCAFLSFFCS